MPMLRDAHDECFKMIPEEVCAISTGLILLRAGLVMSLLTGWRRKSIGVAVSVVD